MFKKELIGKGSFGKVYKLSTQVGNIAIKQINCFSQIHGQMIEEESQIQKRCNHINIVRQIGFFRNGPKCYIAMEYVEGPTLQRLMHQKLNEKQILLLVTQISIGLLNMKKNKIIHRDIKPSNIIISEKGIAKIIDFGVSENYDSSNQIFHHEAGTYPYMAPQLFMKKKFDYAIDMWALGVIIYQLTFGRNPFSGRQITDIQDKVLNFQPIIEKTTPETIKKILSILLRKDPSKRAKVENILALPFIRKLMDQILSGKKAGIINFIL